MGLQRNKIQKVEITLSRDESVCPKINVLSNLASSSMYLVFWFIMTERRKNIAIKLKFLNGYLIFKIIKYWMSKSR